LGDWNDIPDERASMGKIHESRYNLNRWKKMNLWKYVKRVKTA